MAEIILRRIGYLLLTMFIVSVAVFVISEIVPIDVKEPEPTSQGVSAGGLILSIVLGGALGFAGAHLARRAFENA